MRPSHDTALWTRYVRALVYRHQPPHRSKARSSRLSAIVHATLALAMTSAWAVQPSGVAAHGLRTAYLEVTEQAAGAALVRFRLPSRSAATRPLLPADCALVPLGPSTASDSGELTTWKASCDSSLAGRALEVAGLGPHISEAVVFYTGPSGASASTLLTAVEPRWNVPHTQVGLALVRRYVQLGFEHILLGYDHLLFVFLLVLWMRDLRGVLIAESAFTLSHTVSFSLTSLGLVRVPAAPAEACIALSLLLMALDVDIAKRSAPPSPGSGAFTALVFGVVHGLGFAGALQETGLPATYAAHALVSFGVGVEIGQLGFALLCFLLLRWVRRLPVYPRLSWAAIYAIGTTSAYWLFERLVIAVALGIATSWWMQLATVRGVTL